MPNSDPAAITTGIFFLACFGFVLLFFYVLPILVAYKRRMAQRGLLTVLNLLIGWTGVLWIVCLFWAVIGETDLDVQVKRRQLEVKTV